MAVQFLFDPLDAVLDQRDEIKVGMKQLGKVFLGVIAVIRDDLRIVYAKHLQLFQCILDRNDIRLVAGLFREGDRLTGLDRIKRQKLDGFEPVMRFVEPVPGFRYPA